MILKGRTKTKLELNSSFQSEPKETGAFKSIVLTHYIPSGVPATVGIRWGTPETGRKSVPGPTSDPKNI